jgi:hypothetical protein
MGLTYVLDLVGGYKIVLGGCDAGVTGSFCPSLSYMTANLAGCFCRMRSEARFALLPMRPDARF